MAHAYPGRSSARDPGWPARLGPLRVRAGVVALRPVRLRDGGAWSAIRIRDERYLAPWEPTMPGGWTERHAPGEWPARWFQLRAAGRRGTALPFAVTLDDRFVGHVMVGNVVREPLLSAYVGYWVDSTVAGGSACTAGRPGGGRRTSPAWACGRNRVSAGGACPAATSTSTATGAT